ncbi:MAG: MotA/TolQ/ExbB proton channel family protein [Flavobacteriaceae bacterium]|jgi:biopolymer transport protein ExbB/TolQ|nr:MotA/TolQ/ExbB proton channel family protein [Flavobacteriaceae bacterium]
MELISKTLFWVANSLLIPDIIVLLFLFVRSLFLTGSFYNQFMIKRKNDKTLTDKIDRLSLENIEELKKVLPENNNSIYIKYLRDLLERPSSEAYSDYLISNFENEADKDLFLSKILAKLGPVLGLIGTLIAMSPALVGLSTGDISGMAYNMQVVFATTVVGLVVSVIGLVTLQFKQRWYAKEVNNLDYVSRILTEKAAEHEKEKKNK